MVNALLRVCERGIPGKQSEAKRNELDGAERTSNTGSAWSPEHTATQAKQILGNESTFALRNSHF